MNRNVIVIGSVVFLIGAFAWGAMRYEQDQAALAAEVALKSSDAIVREGAQRLGAADAKVVITEFFDPACETCAEFAPYMREFVEKNPGKVQLVERYAPFHPGSDKMVAILEAARRQDKYWETLEIMFSSQRVWADHQNPQPDLIWDLLAKGGLDVDRLRVDMNDPAIVALIKEDLKDAKSLGVTQTPEFFVNGKPLPSWGLRQLKDLVSSELKANY